MLDLPLSYGERATLSFGALYHPWLVAQAEEGQLRRFPADGAVAGIMARRSLARGAWIAPANEPLRGLVALTPAIDRSRWLDLQQAHVNLVRHEPYGFVALSSETLSIDDDLRQINVRRLLQLLRRLALRLGPGLVFEPHDDAFRRRVRRDLEGVLRDLFARGAFAGDVPDRSYQVVFRSTPQDVEQGRFVADLRVAPSLPMEFLNVRLAQVGNQTVVTEGR
jgi:phage tail sheath protein FI